MTDLGWKLVAAESINSPDNPEFYVVDNLASLFGNISRVYCISGLSRNVERGFHAHKKLKQLIVVSSGTIEFKLESSNGVKETLTLSAGRALLIYRPVWRVYVPKTDNASLVTICSQPYDVNDYIRNYDEFTSGNV